MQSLKSTALEPTRVEMSRLSLPGKAMRLLPVYGLPILMLVLILVFSLVLPDTFPTMLNLRSVLGEKGVIAILSLAAMIPMMAGRIDLTVGYGIVMWHILAIALQTRYGLPWEAVVVAVLLLGCLLGA
jgi:ribose transport system permease protein